MYKIAIISFSNLWTNNIVGGAKEIINRVNVVKGIRNCKIYVYFMCKSNEVISIENKDDNVQYYSGLIKNKLKNVFSRYPISVVNRYNEDLVTVMKENDPYDLVLYEGTHMILYRLKNSIEAKLHVLRMHDIESDYRKQLFHSSYLFHLKIMQLLESYKYRYIENNHLGIFDKLLSISKLENDTLIYRYPHLKQKMAWMPPAVEIASENYSKNTSGYNLLYFGDLTISYNIEGINWFLKNSYKIIVQHIPDVKFDIVGMISEKIKRKLRRKNVIVHGYVNNLKEYIKNADVIILPILHGAGVKIKLIESISYGKIVVATTKAIEGTDLIHGKHLLVTDDFNEFSYYVIDILKNKDRYLKYEKASSNHAKNVYSLNKQRELIMDLLLTSSNPEFSS